MIFTQNKPVTNICRWPAASCGLRLTAVFIGCFAVSTGLAHADTKKFIVTPADSSLVTFESTAKMEFIEGDTRKLQGEVNFDPSNLSAGAQGWFECDLRTLRTGIEARDEHMREKYLETDKFPTARFDLKVVSGLPNALTPGKEYPATFAGKFTIHGATRDISATGTVRVSGSSEKDVRVAISAKFPIKLDDYKVERPRAVFLKLAETIEITVASQMSFTLGPTADSSK